MNATSAAASAGTLNLPDYRDVERAANRIKGIAHKTPVLTSRTANQRTGGELFFKCENFQRGGAFKFRGAYNAIAALDDAQRRRGVVCFSSGNHAQAIALAGQLQGAPVTVVMPTDAPAMKAAATQGYGAEIVFYDRYTDDREAITRKLAAERGLAAAAALRPSRHHRRPGHGGQGTDRGGGPARRAAGLPRRRRAFVRQRARRRGAVTPSSSGRASSRRPAMTGSVRSARARSSGSRCPARSPTAR